MKHVLRLTNFSFLRIAPLLLVAMISLNMASAQTVLTIAEEGDFAWTSGQRITYTYPSGDVINYLVATVAGEGYTFAAPDPLSTNTGAICAPATRRVQVNAFDLILNSTSASKIVIRGTSSGTTARTLRAIFVDDVRLADEAYTATTTFENPTTNSTCGDITVEGLTVPKGAKVTVVLGSSPASTPQNLRVSAIIVTEGLLPVRLLSFDAFKRTNGVEVTWKASNEAEGKSYSVERSNNGQDFEVLKKVETLGAGSYSFMDNTPKPGRIAYYRLQMEDVDGEKTYSKIKAINLDGSGALKLFPNPATNGNLFATFSPVTEPTLVRIVNPSGQIVQTMQLAAFTEQAQINTAGLKAGVYMLQIVNGSEVQTSRFLKQ